jgi:hypothetical protein
VFESPFLGNINLLATRELELGTPKSFNDGILMPVISPDGHQRLSDLDTSDGSLGFAKGASHSGLEPIGTSARQHFVDTQDMERMDTDPDVELILSSVLDHVLVAANTSSLKSFGRQLLQLIRHKMDTQRELVNTGLLTSQIVDPDLGVGDTTTETGFGVRFVLLPTRSIVERSRWVDVLQDVIVTVRTNLTPNPVSVVVSPTPRSGSTIWDVRRPVLTSSLCVSILCLMSWSNCLPKLLRLLVFAATSTWSSTLLRISSTSGSVSILSMSCVSTKCCRALVPIGSKPE